jgi:Tc toxin complex TcA C-terminal TcB-binding domain
MPSLTQRIRMHSFLDRPAVGTSVVDSTDTDAALLSQIDSLLNAAGASFTARHYDDAVKIYLACESLIYAHLDPQWDPELTGKVRPLLPRDPSLFGPLLSATCQWLNVLPVAVSASPVRPATPVAAPLLSSVSGLYGAGIGRVSANPAASAAALSDLHLATIFADQGNTAASAAAVARAQSLDPAAAAALAPPATAPPQAPAPAAPAAPTASVRPAPPAALAPAAALDARSTASPLRVPGLSRVTGAVPVLDLPELPNSLLAQRQAGLLTGAGTSFTVKTLQWPATGTPDVGAVESALYAPHVTAAELPDALTNPAGLWDRALQLPHDYFYVIPLALAQCYQALGDYARAETYYLQAARYAYLNTQTEGPHLWVCLATLYSQWGDNVYQQGDAATAATIYGNVISPTGTTAPSTPLYTLAGLATAAQIATALLPQLASLVTNGVSSVAADDVDIAKVLLKIYGKLGQISVGLDYLGNYAATVPIWTFSYLQQVAVNFTQLALQAENEVINFWTQADQATLTQTQLSNQVDQANKQVQAAQQQVAAAKAQADAYQAALTLAQTRAADATQDAQEYNIVNSQVILRQAMAQQVSGGDSGDYNAVSAMASNMLAGQGGSGSRGTVAAAADLAASRLSQNYQVDSMNRTATEMQQAAAQAQAELTAANAQVRAAQAGAAVAQLEAQGAAQTLQAFDADTFTPQVWTAMGNFVQGIYEEYMSMALQAAKLMQQAYNFENDATVSYIKPSYPGLVNGLLAADALMADIQSFTDELISSTYGKKQYVKQSISLASRYGYLFETQLRKTGTMTFETTLDDFDSAYPGSYQGRIHQVEVSVQGIVPPSGVSGTLSNNGISVYRLPFDLATPSAPSRVRLQISETLVLSDYDPAQDGVLDSSTGDQAGIFEGAGVAGSWTLSLPRAVNDIDYGTLTDVVLTFLYEARFDPQLVQPVLSGLASRPGYNARETAIPLAWMYPDLFYGFVSSGTLTLNLAASDFPLNQTNPTVSAVSLLASMAPGTSPAGITMTLTAPGKSAVTGVTDTTGAITSQGTSSTWAAAAGGPALGSWTITLPAAPNPALAPGGQLSLSGLTNLVLILDYSFQPRS